MKEVLLTQGKVAIVDDEYFEKVNKVKWWFNEGYAVRHTSRTLGAQKTICMHWEIIGKPKKGFEIDHINGNGLDNRKENLRICSHRQNLMNRRMLRNNTSGYRGVRWIEASKKWRAAIGVNGKSIWLGLFETAEDANEAYQKAAKKYFGEFNPHQRLYS